MNYRDLTAKHLHLICKALHEDFMILKTDDGEMHFAFGLHRPYGKHIYGIHTFITEVDEEHIKKYMFELLHDGWCDHGICMLGLPFERDNFTDLRVCPNAYGDFKTVVNSSKTIKIIADCDGFYGFDGKED